LVVDAALVSRAAEQNNGERVLSETADFDRAVATARQYAGEKTLVLCVGKNDVGGMSLNGYPLRGDHGLALLGTNAAGYPSLTWSTGPNGPRNGGSAPSPTPSAAAEPGPETGAPSAPETTAKNAPQSLNKEPAAFGAPQAINTARDMIAVGVGPGSEALNGFMDNTEIFRIIQNVMEGKEKADEKK
jgi:alkaline phosphatase